MDELNLHSLSPAQPRKDRKRVGRGLGSGKGRYSGRGIKGQKSRSGSHKMAAGFEGGQMPIDMRLPKLRGNTSADAMPIGPFRTYSQPVNLRDLEERFEAGEEVTPEALKAKRLIRKVSVDVKILGIGELSKALSVSAHGFSKTAKEKIEAAGGTVTWLRGEPVAARRAEARGRKPKPAAAADDEPADESADEAAEPPRRPSHRAQARDAAHVRLARQRVARPGAPEAPALHGADPRALPARVVDPGPGRRLRGDRPVPLAHRRDLQPAQPLLRRRAVASSRCSRSGSCRTSRRRSSSS